jgi:hypothetical protein
MSKRRKYPTLDELLTKEEQDRLIQEAAEEILYSANQILDGDPTDWPDLVELMADYLEDLDALVNPGRMTKRKRLTIDYLVEQLRSEKSDSRAAET